MTVLLQTRFTLQYQTMEEFDYSPPGEPLYRFHVPKPPDERELEAEAKFNRARHFDPRVGRWLSADPLGYEASAENVFWYPVS